MDEVDPELIKTFNKLGIPLEEQMALSGMAVDAVMDSVSVKTTFRETLMEKGIIFCSFSEAVREHPDLIQKYLGSVVGIEVVPIQQPGKCGSCFANSVLLVEV